MKFKPGTPVKVTNVIGSDKDYKVGDVGTVITKEKMREYWAGHWFNDEDTYVMLKGKEKPYNISEDCIAPIKIDWREQLCQSH